MKQNNFPGFFSATIIIFIAACGNPTREKAFESLEDSTTNNSSQTRQQDPNEVKIGNQVWARKNLDITQFRSGEMIMEAKTEEEWEAAGNEKKPAWCYYHNDPSNGAKYGKLYNWFAVNDVRKIAPPGWHVATDEDWTTLANFLGGEDIAGIKLKSDSGWIDNGNGNNSSGFSGMPGGYRFFGGIFLNEGHDGTWWTSSVNEAGYPLFRYMYSDNTNIFSNHYNPRVGLSVRCVKD